MDTKNDHPVEGEEDYYVYLPENSICEAWGATALSAGFTRILPGADYPPVRHPDDHHFVWKRGRTLQAYQFALISEGHGRLQAAPRSGVVHKVAPGDVMLLYPGLWHRFAPEPGTGWTEGWIELSGTALDAVMERGNLPVETPLWHAPPAARGIFKRIHELARADALANQPVLSTLGLQLLAELSQAHSREEQGRMRMVERARRMLMAQIGQPGPLEAIAEELGVSYSTLRRLFRRQMGRSLKQYQSEARIRRACEFLRSSERSMKQIAGHLGYSSAFHFSSDFAKAKGLPPSEWRRQNRPRCEDD